jgi:hypothetical protein
MFPSVTRIRCSCGYLKHGARDPLLPIKFDHIFNEYSFEFTTPSGSKGHQIIWHCPSCGGVASQSDRDKFWATVPAAEFGRLRALTKKLNTVQKVEKALGAPDEDRAYKPHPDYTDIQPRSGKPETKKVRVMYYRNLSETADVEFKVYSNGEVQCHLGAKYLGVKRQEPRSSRKRPRRSSRSRSTRTHR